jgi:hypothetical protein
MVRLKGIGQGEDDRSRYVRQRDGVADRLKDTEFGKECMLVFRLAETPLTAVTILLSIRMLCRRLQPVSGRCAWA